MADLAATETACEGAVTGKTHKDQAQAWKRWIKYCKQIGIEDDVFLDGLDRWQRNRIMGAFALALREGRFSSSHYNTLAESTIRGSLGYVASTFRENGRANPTRDEDGELGRLLSRLFRAFKNADPKEEQQKAIPLIVILELAKLQKTATQKAITQLAIFAYFFACRSCEYLLVQQAEKRRTDILRLRNVRFWRRGKHMDHSDPELEYADSVSVTFEWQKNDERDDTVTQNSSGDVLLNATRQLAAIVKRIRNYPGATDDTPISAVWRNGVLDQISSDEMVTALRGAVRAVGEDVLGFKAEEVGTHSIRSGAAMSMYMGEVPIYVMMIISRWKSDAFLRYIRKQIEQFSHNVARRMLRHKFWRHVQAPDSRQ